MAVRKRKRKAAKKRPVPTNPALYARVKAEAKRKFKVYPSAYANAYASKICAGKIKDPSGVKRKDFKGPKPAVKGSLIETKDKFKGHQVLSGSIEGEYGTNSSFKKYYKDLLG